MKKLLSIILTTAVILSAIVCSIPSTAAVSNDTLTIKPSIWRQTATISHIYVPYDTSYEPVDVKVGDVIEVSFDMKTNREDVTGITGIDIKTFFSGGSFTNVGHNDGTATYTDSYYPNNYVAQVAQLGNTVTAPDPWEEPNPTRSHFGYTASTPFGAGEWSDWVNLYRFTLDVNKPGEMDMPSYVVDVNSKTGGYGIHAEDLYDTTAFDYRMSVKVVAHNDSKVLIGDVDGDGNVNVTDATIVQLFAARSESLDGEKYYIADVNNDGSVNITDATNIQLYAANVITQFDRKNIN